MSAPFFFDPLKPFKYDILVVDPPWLFDLRSEAGEEKSPQAQYDCMTRDQIRALPVGELCGPNSWLFLWTCAPLLPFAIECVAAWGFTYKSRMTWRKTTRNGKVRVGPGYVVRSMTEDVLIATIGRPSYTHALPSIFDGLAREHSRKPDSFYALIEDFAPRAWRADVFTRETRDGWDAFGNEATKFDEKASA